MNDDNTFEYDLFVYDMLMQMNSKENDDEEYDD